MTQLGIKRLLENPEKVALFYRNRGFWHTGRRSPLKTRKARKNSSEGGAEGLRSVSKFLRDHYSSAAAVHDADAYAAKVGV